MLQLSLLLKAAFNPLLLISIDGPQYILSNLNEFTCSLVLVTFAFDKDSRTEALSGSHTALYIESSTAFLAGLLPESMTVAMEERQEELQNLAETAVESAEAAEKLKEAAEQQSEAEENAEQGMDSTIRAPGQQSLDGSSAPSEGGTGYPTDNRQDIQNLIEDEYNE